jgi:hypothetical protein
VNDLFCYQAKAMHDPGCKRLIRLPADVKITAEFGGEGDCYRYSLLHRWSNGPLLMWNLMNPSGAGVEFGDSTVAKTGRISRRLGFGGQWIANACAYRATDRMRLLEVEDPVGPRNHGAIREMAATSEMIIIAHGRLPGALQTHADRVVEILLDMGRTLHVLRLSNDGVPVHPLARGKGHIPENIEPQPWALPEAA